MEPDGKPQQPGTHPCACALANLLGEKHCSCSQGRFCSSPGQLQDLCAGLMGVTLTPMGRQEASSHPTTLYISHSVGFIVKLLLQSNPPEPCASTISRRVCPPDTLPFPPKPSQLMQTGYTAGMRNKEVALAASFVHMLGREAAGKEPVPTTKPHLLREKGFALESAESRRGTVAWSKKRERGGREGGIARPLQTCDFLGRISES